MLVLQFTASDYTANPASKITWSSKVETDSKLYKPTLTLSPTKGASVKLSATSLKSPKTNDGTFRVTITARDSDSTTDTITLTGVVMDAPVIKTSTLAKATASSGKAYNAKLEISSGSEPLTWTISGDLPSGLNLTKESKSGRDYYVIAGEPEVPGTYPLTLTVSNDVGVATKNYNLQVSAVAPKIKAPSGFVKKYTVAVSQDFSIDIRAFEITGTKPLSIDIDAVGKALGLEYDSDNGVIKGNIKNVPSKENNTIKIEVRNPYTESKEGKYKPVVYSFTLTVKSPPVGISPAHNFDSDWFTITSVPCYAQIGKNYKATLTAVGGSKPITWDFLLKDNDGNYTYSIIKKMGGKFAGLTFSDNGKISGTPRYEDVFDAIYDPDLESAYVDNGYIRFIAQASNEAGSVYSDEYTIVFTRAPVFKKNPQPKEIIVTNGNGNGTEYLIDDGYSYVHNQFFIDDYFECWDTARIIRRTSNGNTYYSDLGPHIVWSTTSTLPPGLSLINGNSSYYHYGVISGDLKITDPSQVKKYTIKVTATNALGSATGQVVLNVLLPPVIDPEGTLDVQGEQSPLNATLGTAYKLKIPTNTKKPYTWRMEYKSEDVKGVIGDSGLVWNASTGTIAGAKNGMKPGSYDVTVYLSNGASEDKKTMTLTVKPVKLEITTPKQYINVATLTNASVGKEYSFKPKAKGSGTFTWGLTAPDFLVMNPTTGEISSSMSEKDINNGLSGWEDITWNSDNSATIDNIVLSVYDDYGQSASVTARLNIKGLKKSEQSSQASYIKFEKNRVSARVDANTGSDSDIMLSLKGINGFSLSRGSNTHVFWIINDGGLLGMQDDEVSYSYDAGGYQRYYLKVPALTQAQYDRLGSSHKATVTITAFYDSSYYHYSKSEIEFAYNRYYRDPEYYDQYKVTATVDITFTSNVGSSPANNVTTLPENESADKYPEGDNPTLSDDIDHKDLEDLQKLIVLRERDTSDLSTFALGHVSNDVYEIAAVLPELTVSESGQYDIDAMIDEDIEIGKKLFWFALPKDKDSTSDDEIAEFYDESGAEIESVPESRKIRVSVWLTEGVTYEPVIAVKRTE